MVTLRILTRKSTLKVGPYANETVQKLLDLKMYRALRKVYYTYEAISFQDDILDEIHAQVRIPKPGSNPSLVDKVNEMMETRRVAGLFASGKNDAAMHESVHIKKQKQRDEARGRRIVRNRERLSKGTLQAANHGHISISVEADD